MNIGVIATTILLILAIGLYIYANKNKPSNKK